MSATPAERLHDALVSMLDQKRGSARRAHLASKRLLRLNANNRGDATATGSVQTVCQVNNRPPEMCLLNNKSAGAPKRSRLVPWCFGFWLAVLTLFSTWPALSNGQPFFFPDTTAYVRGADLAIAKALGSRFATEWAKDQRRTTGFQISVTGSQVATPDQTPARRVVLAGRSIVYGALLYLGAVTGGMWFPIVVQSAVAIYLVFLFVVRILRLDFLFFALSCGVLIVASSLPFYVSDLMPDVFAGFLILAFAILAVGWGRLSKTERAIASVVILFAVLSHTTHVLLLITLTVLTMGYAGLTKRWAGIRELIGVVAVCVLLSVLWEAAFSFGVNRTMGAPPVRPPFVTARLVSMLGEPAVSRVCASNDFAVCRFQDRFPIEPATFLWSEDEHLGVFNATDVETKHALEKEQMRFAFAIIPQNFGRVAYGVMRDGSRQLAAFRLDGYWYDAQALDFFGKRLPTRDFERMKSTFAARSQAYFVFGSTVLYGTTALGIVGVVTLLLSGGRRARSLAREGEDGRDKIWREATGIQLGGILLNALICGALSGVYDRYEARVIWLIQLLFVTGVFVMWPHLKAIPLFRRDLKKRIAVAEFLHEPKGAGPSGLKREPEF